MPRPALIALDGPDGTGKSTQHALLLDWLTARKVPAVGCVDPGGTALGQQLRQLLLFGRDHRIAPAAEALLFMASRAQLVDEIIRPALGRGEVVVTDRFTLATVVYQGHAGGLDPKELWAAGRVATGGLDPDLTLVFDVDLDTALGRRAAVADRFEGRDREYQEAVRRGFLYEAGMRPGPFQIVDAGPDLATIQQDVRDRVSRLLADYGWTVAG